MLSYISLLFTFIIFKLTLLYIKAAYLAILLCHDLRDKGGHVFDPTVSFSCQEIVQMLKISVLCEEIVGLVLAVYRGLSFC